MQSEILVHRRLSIPLKGGRSYVRGADIFTALVDIVSERWELAGRCELAFRRLPRRTLELSMGESSNLSSSPHTAVANFSFVCAGAIAAGWLSEIDAPIAETAPFDEERLVAGSKIAGQTISCIDPPPCLPIDLAVAMTKSLHNNLRLPQSGQWIFTRLDLERPLRASDVAAMSISLERELGTRITRSDVRVSGKPIGSIYFSVARP
jgi:hypothetical protein